MEFALYLNGVFESVLEEIVAAQCKSPGMVCYLQPYATNTIVKLANNPPSPSNPLTLYIAVTSSLSLVSYRAQIVGWEKKTKIGPSRLEKLNTHIANYQPAEAEIYMTVGEKKPCVNLISVANMERLAIPFSITSLVKISNQIPLKPRSTSGGWSYVHPIPHWVGLIAKSAVQEELYEQHQAEVKNSLELSQGERQERLARAPKLPEIIQTISRSYRRNPDVVATVLLRAAGICEQCGKNAPFTRSSDGTPYLEVHHKTTLANGGEDTVENAIAVCPNCHRKAHFG